MEKQGAAIFSRTMWRERREQWKIGCAENHSSVAKSRMVQGRLTNMHGE
ncbi:hypothetical protein H650_17325 [Enterobacter sp. R4-368]|nr:hypothetical protein H650_17325 [Enterobacter sp. R4-368]